jgi:hypothetical protein
MESGRPLQYLHHYRSDLWRLRGLDALLRLALEPGSPVAYRPGAARTIQQVYLYFENSYTAWRHNRLEHGLVIATAVFSAWLFAAQIALSHPLFVSQCVCSAAVRALINFAARYGTPVAVAQWLTSRYVSRQRPTAIDGLQSARSTAW